jgi:large subunit ribosomal protein L11
MTDTVIPAIVEGGKANAGPPLGPALGPLGVNIGQIIADINKETAAFAGVKVPIKVFIDKNTKKYHIEVGSPPTGELLKKELGIEKGRKGGAEDPKVVGDLPLAKVLQVAKAKSGKNLSKNLKATVNEVLGTCVSLGITVNGQDARKIRAEVQEGKHDSLIGG